MSSSRSNLARLVLPFVTLAVLSYGILLAGCGGKPQPTPTPTKTSTPPATPTPALLAASQARPTATMTATPSPTPPMPDPTVTPTETALPEAPGETPTVMVIQDDAEMALIKIANSRAAKDPTPTQAETKPQVPLSPPTPAPTPAGPTEVNPLTGLTVAAYKLNRRPLGIKVPNFPFEARPQSGLSRADVVIEHEAEASVTRFTAIFWGTDALPEVGPIRSVRLVDGELMSLFKATLVTSGGHPAVKVRATQDKAWASGYQRIICPEAPFLGDGGTMRRIPKPGRRYELTLYSDTASLWNTVSARGVNQRPDFAGMWTFSETPPDGGGSATHLKIVYKWDWSIAEYRYDSGTKTYRRFDMGQPTTDALTGVQIAPSNVLVLYANHVNSDIAADTHNPDNIFYSVIIQLWGEGSGKLLRDGKVYDIRWVRENPQQSNDRLILLDGAGNRVPLRPGPTWIQLVRFNGNVQID